MNKSVNLFRKETSKSFLSCIFEHQEREKEKIANKKSSYNRCINILIIFNISITILSSIIIYCFNDKIHTECGIRILLFLFFGSLSVNTILFFLPLLKKMFNSVFIFIFYGTCIFFIVGFCFYSLLLVITKNIIIPYYIMIFLMALLWSYISTLGDLEVAKLGNSIISALVTLILEFTGNLREAIVLDNDVLGNFKDPDLLSTITSHENIWKIVLFPFVAATLIGLISCEYKEFWIKRYGKLTEEIYTKYE